MLLGNITKLCKSNGISITNLEKKCGFGNGTICKWASSSPSVENARKVAEYFGTTVDDLIKCDLAPQESQEVAI